MASAPRGNTIIHFNMAPIEFYSMDDDDEDHEVPAGGVATSAHRASRTKADGENPDEDGEAAPVKARSQPPTPSRAEIEEHEATHYPYRSWCRSCVAMPAQGGETSMRTLEVETMRASTRSQLW